MLIASVYWIISLKQVIQTGFVQPAQVFMDLFRPSPPTGNVCPAFLNRSFQISTSHPGSYERRAPTLNACAGLFNGNATRRYKIIMVAFLFGFFQVKVTLRSFMAVWGRFKYTFCELCFPVRNFAGNLFLIMTSFWGSVISITCLVISSKVIQQFVPLI